MDTTNYRMAGSLPRDSKSDPIEVLSPGTHQSVAYTGTADVIASATGSTGASPTSVIRVVVTSAAYVKISADGTLATTSDFYMAADTPEYFKVAPTGVKVSAIQVSAGGTLHVTEMTL